MKKSILSIILISFISIAIKAQSNDQKLIINETMKWQTEMNEQFKNPDKSPLKKEDISHFNGLDFYPINSKFVVKAKLTFTPFSPEFRMKTTTARLPRYKKFAIASFTVDGKNYELSIYQNLDLLDRGGYDDYLFLPFLDATAGTETYGAGRYLELKIPEGNEIIINFNMAYNPYCAYNERYSCPIPPKENNIDLKIEAGVKKYH